MDQYLPPVKVPIIPVRKAAAVDAAAAWGQPEATGQVEAKKISDGVGVQMKEVLGKADLPAWARKELEQRHSQFLGEVEGYLRKDPAFFANESNRNFIARRSEELIAPSRITAAANQRSMWLKDEDSQRSQLSQLAFVNGRPLDETYGEVYDALHNEQDPRLIRSLYLPYKAKRGANGQLFADGEERFRLDQPGAMNTKDAAAELDKIIGYIKPWTTEKGRAKITEGAPPGVAALYESIGGGAYGHQKDTQNVTTKSNIDIINDLTLKLQSGDTWRNILPPDAQNALLGEAYTQVSRNSSAAATLKLPKGIMTLPSGRKVDLRGSHLDARKALKEAMRTENQPDFDAAAQAWGTLREADMANAEQSIRDRIIAQLNLTKVNDVSDVQDRDIQYGGVRARTAEEGAVDKGQDLLAQLDTGDPSLKWGSQTTVGSAGGRDGLPLWGTSVAGNADFEEAMARIAFTITGDGIKTPRTLGDLAQSQMGIYNAKTLGSIASPGATVDDHVLKEAKVLPGNGEVVLLPADPKDMESKKTEIKNRTARMKATQEALNKLAAKKTRTPLTPQEDLQLQQLTQTQAYQFRDAQMAGFVPAIRMRAVARQYELGGSARFASSARGQFNPKSELQKAGSSLSSSGRIDSDKTGVRALTLDEGKQVGFSDQWGQMDDFVTFDVYVTPKNLSQLGGRASQIDNSVTKRADHQTEMQQGRMNTAAAAAPGN